MMRPASMQPLVRCARRGMPAQHCLCCGWGGQNSRAGGWTLVGWSQHSTLRGLHASLLPPRIAAIPAVCLMRRSSPVSTVGLLLNGGQAPRSSTPCTSRVQLLHASSGSRHLRGYGPTGPDGRPGHAGAAGAAHGCSGGGPPAALPYRHACGMPLERTCGCAVAAGRRANASQLVRGATWLHHTTY